MNIIEQMAKDNEMRSIIADQFIKDIVRLHKLNLHKYQIDMLEWMLNPHLPDTIKFKPETLKRLGDEEKVYNTFGISDRLLYGTVYKRPDSYYLQGATS